MANSTIQNCDVTYDSVEEPHPVGGYHTRKYINLCVEYSRDPLYISTTGKTYIIAEARFNLTDEHGKPDDVSVNLNVYRALPKDPEQFPDLTRKLIETLEKESLFGDLYADKAAILMLSIMEELFFGNAFEIKHAIANTLHFQDRISHVPKGSKHE